VKYQPLTELEMFELLQVAYPGKYPDDTDEAWESAMEFADNLCGFDELADLLGRIVMLTMPMSTAITGGLVHCLGEVTISGGNANMVAAVKRDVI
jgi:hypothetical protein